MNTVWVLLDAACAILFGRYVVNIVLSGLGWVRPLPMHRLYVFLAFLLTMLTFLSRLLDGLIALLRDGQ